MFDLQFMSDDDGGALTRLFEFRSPALTVWIVSFTHAAASQSVALQ
jgi:hypothetical protein